MVEISEQTLLNAQIIEVYRICEVTCFVFQLSNKDKLHLHVSCLLRVVDSDGTLVICSTNLSDCSPNYRKKWYKKYDWSKFGSTVYDDAIKDYKDKLFSTIVKKFEFQNKDMTFKFENGMRMDVLVSVTKYDDADYSENYRFFEKGKTEEHFEV